MFEKILIGYDESERGAEATTLAETLSDPHTGALVPSDATARVLCEVAEAEQADLLVIGSSRRLPGTTAQRLLDEAPCAVAVAPPGYSGGDIRRIGVAYDGSPEAGVALQAAVSFAREHCTALTVYCAVEAPSPPVDIRPEWLLIQRVPATEVASRAYGAVDLLFVGSDALLGNVSGALVRAAGCPVVVTPHTAIAPRRATAVAVEASV